MKPSLTSLCTLGAALVIAAAGLLRLIDENTMIILVIVLVVCMPNACGRARRA